MTDDNFEKLGYFRLILERNDFDTISYSTLERHFFPTVLLTDTKNNIDGVEQQLEAVDYNFINGIPKEVEKMKSGQIAEIFGEFWGYYFIYETDSGTEYDSALEFREVNHRILSDTEVDQFIKHIDTVKSDKTEFYAEGNNGGNYVKIRDVKSDTDREGLVYVEIGESCVTTVKSIIPVTILSGILSNILQNDNKIRENFETWSKTYLDNLMKNCEHDVDDSKLHERKWVK